MPHDSHRKPLRKDLFGASTSQPGSKERTNKKKWNASATAARSLVNRVKATDASDQKCKDSAAADERPEPAVLPLCADLTQILTQTTDSGPSSCRKSKAGDRIRTGDVQLGKR